MGIYEVSEDTAAIISELQSLNENLTVAVVVIAAVLGMAIGIMIFKELLSIWLR